MIKQGYAVRALVRTPSKAQTLEQIGVTLIQGDLANTAALDDFVAGANAIIHGAGAVRGNSQEDFDAVNVAGTQALITALDANNPTAKLVHLSSIVAREPQLSFYSQSKFRGENTFNQRSDLNWVIIRPPAVYGPGDVEMLPLFQTMYRGLAVIPGSPDARTSLIHVDDLVAAILAALTSDNARHQTFHLGDGREGGYSWREIASIGEELWSRRVRLWQIPTWLLDGVARANSLIASITGKAPMLTPPKLRELRHPDWVADNGHLTKATGWEPQTPLKSGLEALQISAL